jgi:FHA domain/zinc-ribbon domain
MHVLHPGKLCPLRAGAKGSDHAKFANMRESRPLRYEGFARRSSHPRRAAGAWPAHGGGETAVWRKRREDKTGRGRRGLFAWLMDRRGSAQVPWAASPEAPEADEPAEGRSSGAMPHAYCARCGRPNPDGARFCSNCGAQLSGTRAMPFGAAGSGGARPGETTSTLSLNRPDDPDFGDDLLPDSAAFGALPDGSALLLVMRGPNAGSRFRLDGDLTTAGRHPDSDIFLDDVTVSRRHAEFYREGAFFTVRDVGSLNGTYVNRERIEEAQLAGGDEVQIGKFRLLFLTSQNLLDPRTSSADPRGRGAQDYA